ncbi:hypothetical protein OG689_40070 [Kitasatospora sp. NBC_00240]|uniref:hypothetical protein n=1 Tax=Kitasatospora sp. NBC_00240 TaxID=2903567 RepID=UPI00224EDCE9|nr:hypothetical protein [Kitasatospora sp. NBC_00240]MCX5215377.1 hypothetical protein [Kitasatospora sp. NBC_00240]
MAAQLHALIRSTLRGATDQADDRWSEQDWHRAAERVPWLALANNGPPSPDPTGCCCC